MKKLMILFVLLIPALLYAQSVSDLQNKSYGSSNGAPLFDPSKLKMSQSYSFSYYSGNGQNGTLGYYLNSIEYAFSDPLKIRVDIGYLHSPSSIVSKNSSAIGSGAIIPGVSVDWRPTDNLRFNVDIRQVPAGYNSINGSRHNYNQWEDYR